MRTGGRIIKITVSYHSSRHQVSVPAESTFADVKKLLAHKTGLEPEEQTLIFRGKKKQDEENLNLEGVKDNSEIFLFKEASSSGRRLEENQENFNMSKAFEAVARVRAEVDQLSESISALEVAVKCGTNVAGNEFLTLSELLMRQLLILDSIQAEGEARVQRKAEVCRVQNLVDKLDSLKEINSTPSSNNGNAFSDQNGETFNSGTGSMNAPHPLSSSGESNIDFEPITYYTGFELQGNKAEDPSTSDNLVRRRRRLGAQVQEGTGRRAPLRVSEPDGPSVSAHPVFHDSFSSPSGDFQDHLVNYPPIEIIHDRSQFPGQTETDTSQTQANDSFLYSRSQSVPSRASTSEDYSEEDTYVNVGEILRLISPSLSVTEASASVSTNVAKSLSILCELDDNATKLLEMAFNKYPNLMNIRSDRRKTFIRWMFSSLSNLLQLLSTASANGTLDAQKKSEIEVVIGELGTFGFDTGFIGEMRSQVSEAWEARVAVDNAPSELKTLCSKAEDLNQVIADLERSLAAAKAEVSQIEDRISNLCELVEVEENQSPIFQWITE